MSDWVCMEDSRADNVHVGLSVFQGRRNYIILTLAVCFAVTGSVLTGLSKWDKWKDTGNDNTTTAMTTATAVVTTSNN